MSEPSPAHDQSATPREQAHLEHAHHEICTALTVLRSNVELVRVELRLEAEPSKQVAVQRHLTELDLAADRLRQLATQMRTWHGPGAPTRPGEIGEPADRDTRLLP